MRWRKFYDEQQNTSAALGKVANLLEQVFDKQTPPVNEEVIEATSRPKTKPTIKSMVVVKERTKQPNGEPAQPSLGDGEIQDIETAPKETKLLIRARPITLRIND